MNIIKKCPVLLTILLASVLLAADITDSEGNFLWKVNNKSDSTAAYLLGSIHIVPDDIYPLSDRIMNAYQNSDYLAVEADINSLDAGKITRLTMTKGLYTEGSSLTDELDKDMQTKLTRLLENTGIIGIEQAKRMKPWLLAMTLQQMLIIKRGYDPANGIDMHFLRSAQNSKKDIFELESAEFQLDLISGFSDQIQIKFLKSTIEEAESFDEKYDEIVKAWKDDDVGSMAKIINKEIKSDPELKILYTKLISERNRNMTEKIEKWIKEYEGEIFFIVVGAGHLTGEDGIVNLLRQKGFDVQKL